MTDGPEDYPIPEGFVMPEEDRELEIRLREIALGYVPWMGYVLPCPEPPAGDPTEYQEIESTVSSGYCRLYCDYRWIVSEADPAKEQIGRVIARQRIAQGRATR